MRSPDRSFLRSSRRGEPKVASGFLQLLSLSKDFCLVACFNLPLCSPKKKFIMCKLRKAELM